MNFDPTRSGALGLVLVALVLSALVTLFWMWVAWRAMRAHERLADAVERISRKQPTRADDNPFRDAPQSP
jgi:uncharacterized membrane protein